MKLTKQKERTHNIVEVSMSDTLQCSTSYILNSGMKLVVRANGDDTHDCDIIWRLGYRNILVSIKKYGEEGTCRRR